MTVVASSAYGQCCGSWPPVHGAPLPTFTASVTPTSTVTGSLPPTFTPTQTRTPTPTNTTSAVCAFHEICDNSALAAVNDNSNGGTYVWANAFAAETIDTAQAGGNTVAQSQVSQYLYVTDFAGSTANPSIASCVTGDQGVNLIPDDATILGLRIQIRGCEQGSLNPPDIEDVEMRLVVGGTLSSDNKALAGGWDSTWNCVHGDPSRYYGSISDLWGFGSLTGAQLKTSTFGVALSVTATGGPVGVNVDGFAFRQICYKLVGE